MQLGFSEKILKGAFGVRTLIVFVVFAGFIFLNFLPQRKTRLKKENVIYVVLASASFIVLLLYSFGIRIPSPTRLIEATVKAVFPIN